MQDAEVEKGAWPSPEGGCGGTGAPRARITSKFARFNILLLHALCIKMYYKIPFPDERTQKIYVWGHITRTRPHSLNVSALTLQKFWLCLNEWESGILAAGVHS